MNCTIFKVALVLFSILCCISCINEDQILEQQNQIDKSTEVLTRSVVGSNDYYWYKGKKILITKSDNLRYYLLSTSDQSLLSTSSTFTTSGALNEVKHSNNIIPVTSNQRSSHGYNTSKLMWTINDESIISKSIAENIIYDAPCYSSESNALIALGHLFYVKLINSTDESKLLKLADDNGVIVLGKNEYMPLWYTLMCTNESTGNALEMANQFYETGIFASCQPDLICDDTTTSLNDSYYTSQWNLYNPTNTNADINYEAARNITTGSSSVIIAVLDQGIQRGHEDLPNIHSLSYDTDSGVQSSIVSDDHGTACAGIIGAAANNGKGIAGIAPDCMLMDISSTLASNADNRQKRANGINWGWLNGASVISNSWSSSVHYEIIDDAIENAMTNGRNGKGCVIVFASGNENLSSVSYPGNTHSDILTVGASSPCGMRKSPNTSDGEYWWGSNYGTELDILAPGVLIPTTDRLGTDGYSSNDYTLTFNGTSSACPHVAAVAGLVLSVNPNLSQREVSDIIESTAQKLDAYNYSNISTRPNGTWNIQSGYGLLDAYAAVLAAHNELNQDIYVSDVNITYSDQYKSYRSIYGSDISIANNAEVTFEASNGIEFEESFTVESGCEFYLILN